MPVPSLRYILAVLVISTTFAATNPMVPKVYICDECYDEVSKTGTLVEPEVEEEVVEEPVVVYPLYSVNGSQLAPEYAEFLYKKLDERGLSWWYTYALCQAYQESKFNIYAVNQQNFEDKGLFQYKERYWHAVSHRYGVGGSDICDPYAQITVYVGQIAERMPHRANDVWYILSDHYTGCYGYSQEYVNQVMQWYWTLVKEN